MVGSDLPWFVLSGSDHGFPVCEGGTGEVVSLCLFFNVQIWLIFPSASSSFSYGGMLTGDGGSVALVFSGELVAKSSPAFLS